MEQSLDVLDTALRLSDGRDGKEEVTTHLRRGDVLLLCSRPQEAVRGELVGTAWRYRLLASVATFHNCGYMAPCERIGLMEVTVRDLKNRLSEYLRRVQQGEELIVTSRGRPVARLGPLPKTQAGRLRAVREQLAASPWVSVGSGGRPRGSKDPIPVHRGDKQLSELVLEDRR